jgi:hypothetical protein
MKMIHQSKLFTQPDKQNNDKRWGFVKANERARFTISRQEILGVTHLSQPEAAKQLGISLSTLKRKFYEYELGRWPISNRSTPSQDGNSQMGNFHSLFRHHLPIAALINEKDQAEKFIDSQTQLILNNAFKKNL